MGSFGWYHIFFRYFVWITCINCHNPGRGRDIDEEYFGRRIVNRPTGATRHLDFGDALLASEIDDRRGLRIRNGRIADIGDHQKTALGVEGDTVRPYANANLQGVALISWRKYRDGILAPVCRKNQTARFGHQCARYCGQTRNRLEVTILSAVDHVDRIIGGVRNVDPIRG